MVSDHRIEVRLTASTMLRREQDSLRRQQLRGTARIWWDNYRTMLPADHVVTWEEFRTAF